MQVSRKPFALSSAARVTGTQNRYAALLAAAIVIDPAHAYVTAQLRAQAGDGIGPAGSNTFVQSIAIEAAIRRILSADAFWSPSAPSVS
jgi:hypothetical protein